MRNPFQASSEKLPPSDQHDELVRTVDARCAQLREQIERAVEDYNFGREISKRIYLSHTEEGLPIRVSKAKKIPLWGI